MAYVITESSIGTKDTTCVDVCPVDCIYPRKDEADFATADMLYIHHSSRRMHRLRRLRSGVSRGRDLRARRNAAEVGRLHSEERGLLQP